ncbi:MAG TPA: DUF6526 family protein [Acidobacteriaceae bacterium]
MAQEKHQSFRSHASLDPIYHYGVAPALILNLIVAIVLLVMSLHTHLLTGIWIVLLSAILLLLVVRLRTYPLKVQDRVIRLEERLRLEALLPEALRKRIPELTEDQLIGLRFASDDELPSLVEMTLEKKLDRRQIKERIQNWRPDHWRI